jgi:hypothetical protein
MTKVDLHIHTSYSPDATINPKTLVDQLYAHPFIKTIAVTDHNTIQGYEKVQALASAYPDLLVIPGVEVSTFNGDLIILGIAELPPKPWTIENVIDFTKERNALTIAAHPYRAYGLGDLTKNYAVDAIETLNGTSQSYVNKLAENLAKEMGLPGVAGSDAHNVNELWTVYTEVQASSDVNEILKAIKNGLVKVASVQKSIHF